jgi:predicted alpha/beta hydrolase
MRADADVAPAIEYITASDGARLALHRIGRRGAQPVILVPGTFSNWSFWLGTRSTGFARVLARSGFEAIVLDLRGHGASQRQAPGERWTFDMWGRLDVPAAVRHVAAAGERPLLVGHSAGGASGLVALAMERAVSAVVPAAIIAATPLPWLQPWRRAAAHVVRLAARRLPAFPARLLRLGPEDELPGVMEQWMEWNLNGHWIGDDGTDYTAALATVRTPLLFLAGAADTRFAPPDAVAGLHDIVGSAHRRFVRAGRNSGFSRDYGHVDLIASRAAQAEVWPLMIDWLRAATAADG